MKFLFSFMQVCILILQAGLIGWLITNGILNDYTFSKILLIILFTASILINIFLAHANAKNVEW